MVGKTRSLNKRNDWKFAYFKRVSLHILVSRGELTLFTYMLDFILKPGGNLEQDNASLLKFKGNPSIDTCRKLRWKFVCEYRIWPGRKSVCQPHAPVILQRYLRYCFTMGSLTRAYSCKRPALVIAVFSNSRGGRLQTSVYSTSASRAEQTSETSISNWT